MSKKENNDKQKKIKRPSLLWTVKQYTHHILWDDQEFMIPGMAFKGGLAAIAMSTFVAVSYVAAAPFVLATGLLSACAIGVSVGVYGVTSGAKRLMNSLRVIQGRVQGHRNELILKNNKFKTTEEFNKAVRQGLETEHRFLKYFRLKMGHVAQNIRHLRQDVWQKIEDSKVWRFMSNAPLTKSITETKMFQKVTNSKLWNKIKHLIQDKKPTFHTMAATGASLTIYSGIIIAAELMVLPVLGLALGATAAVGFGMWGTYALYSVAKNLTDGKSKKEQTPEGRSTKTLPKPDLTSELDSLKKLPQKQVLTKHFENKDTNKNESKKLQIPANDSKPVPHKNIK